MNRKWFYMALSILVAAFAVSAIMAATFRGTEKDLRNGSSVIENFKNEPESGDAIESIPYGNTLAEHEAAFEKWGGIDMDADSRADYPKDFVPITPQEQSLLNIRNGISEDMLIGDDGDEGPLITGNIETERRANESYAMLLCRMAFKYNKGVPYMENGADWGGGILPSDGCPKGMAGLTGIGNPEYVQMLYMYTFGYVPDELMDMERISGCCRRITQDGLKTGDIAIMELEDGRKDFAVCIGAYKGNFLFAHCANTADNTFANGNSKICFMKSQTDSYYRGSEPVGFNCFYESPVRFWGNPDGSVGEDNNGLRILIEVSEKPYGRDAVSRYADRLAHEAASGDFGSFLSDFAHTEIIKYGYEYTDGEAYKRYLYKVYETMSGKDCLYTAFVNSRDGHYNAAVYGINYAESKSDVIYDYDSLDIMYFTVFDDKEKGFTMLPYNAGTIEYNYSRYGLSPIKK